MTAHRIGLPVLSLALGVLVGCSDTGVDPAHDRPGAAPSGRATVVVPAGSVDALADAIALAGPDGTVTLASGLHIESGSVLIPYPIRLLGEAGAVLESDTQPDLSILDPALHVKDADGVVIEGVEIRPAGAIGGTAVLIENARSTEIRGCVMVDHQYPVMIEEGDRTVLEGNQIMASTAWQTGEIEQSLGVTVINGDRISIVGNDVSGGLFGIWACDTKGKLLNNTCHDNLIGIILCKVPEGSFELPGGALAGAEESANKWMVKGNDASNNLDTGYLVIDGAYDNRLIKNTGSGNAAYDMELAGDSVRFGFLTPTSVGNVVVATQTPGLVIKDCGEDNQVVGGSQVDVEDDPCF